MLYKFYSKVDDLKESIHTIHAASKNSAIESFAKMKQLSVQKFNKLFEVAEYDRSQKEA